MPKKSPKEKGWLTFNLRAERDILDRIDAAQKVAEKETGFKVTKKQFFIILLQTYESEKQVELEIQEPLTGIYALDNE